MGLLKKKKEEIKRVSFDDVPQEQPAPLPVQQPQPQPQMPAMPETWIVGEEAIESRRVIYNQKTGEKMDVHSAIAKILNAIED